MASTRNRLNGYGLSLIIDGQEYNMDTNSWEITEEEKDAGTLTFADAAAGSTGQVMLNTTVVQSLDADSLHQIVSDNVGKRNVPFTLAPAANSEPSPSEPHFTGMLNFPKLRPSFGIEAGEEDATTEIAFTCTEFKKLTGSAS